MITMTYMAKVIYLNERQFGQAVFMIDLGFKTTVHHSLFIEGVSAVQVPSAYQDKAMHCLTLLLGGKSCLIQIENKGITHPIKQIARVYTANTPEGNVPDDVMQDVCGVRRAQIGLLFTKIAAQNYDPQFVLSCLNPESRK